MIMRAILSTHTHTHTRGQEENGARVYQYGSTKEESNRHDFPIDPHDNTMLIKEQRVWYVHARRCSYLCFIPKVFLFARNKIETKNKYSFLRNHRLSNQTNV